MKPDSPILTIAIPTYNRAAKLRAQLERLMPQLQPEVRVMVYDNASSDNTREVVAQYQSSGIGYVCAKVNGGACRNLLRCLEECPTKWLWMLSDDDTISASAVADLLRLVKNSQADFIHTSSPLNPHPVDVDIKDISALLEGGPLCALIWLSVGVYRISAVRPLVQVFAESMFTWVPQLVVMMSLLERHQGKGLFSSTQLIIQAPVDPIRWSTLHFIIRSSQAPEFLQEQSNQAMLAQRIYSELYHILLLMGLREANDRTTINRWQCARKLGRLNLKVYGATSPVWNIIRKNQWYRAGQRKSTLLALHHAVLVMVLSWCPADLFLPVLKWLPKPVWGWEALSSKEARRALDSKV